MSADQLEQRLAAIEQTLAEIKQQLGATAESKKPWWERITPIPEEDRAAAAAAAAYGRYWRKTGREAPPEWNPGDPIPEPEADE